MDKSVQSLQETIKSGNACTESGNHTGAANAFKDAVNACQGLLISLHCARARALLSSEQHETAKDSAQAALRLDEKSAMAWYLNGAALLNLKCYPNAKSAFLKASQFERDLALKSSYSDWAGRCDDHMNRATSANENEKDTNTVIKESDSSARNSPKMQWYQSAKFVTIDIYAKNVVKEESEARFEESTFTLRLRRPNMDDYTLNIELAECIIPSESVWNVSRFKIEVRLVKLKPGTWKSLDRDMHIVSAAIEAGVLSQRRSEADKRRQEKWSSLAEKELKDYKEDGSAMELFQMIYKDADEDTRRAMVKSYSESGGQVLSTNWNEVKEKKVVYEGGD